MDQSSKKQEIQGWFLWKVPVKIILGICEGKQVEKLIDSKAQSLEWIKNLETNYRKQANVVNRNVVFGVRKVMVPQCSQLCAI